MSGGRDLVEARLADASLRRLSRARLRDDRAQVPARDVLPVGLLLLCLLAAAAMLRVKLGVDRAAGAVVLGVE